jgi:hypothetical protein
MQRFLPVSTDPQGVVAGLDTETKRPVLLSGKARKTHMEVLGASGLGKTYFLEHLIREDILEGRGVCLIDPTGNLYDRIVGWLASEPDLDPPLILMNPADDEYVTGYNPLRRSGKDIDFRVDEIINAIARVWGVDNLQSTPLIKTCLKLIFLALAERGLTLVEARHCISPDNTDVRDFLTSPFAGTLAGDLWAQYSKEKTDDRFFSDFSGAMRRLLDFSAPRLQRIFGQQETAIDLRQLMDTNGVLLVNLSRKALSHDAARLLGTLLVYDLLLTAQERPKGAPPFYLYVDECYDYMNEDVGRILDRCRQFGLHAILAHQHLSQIKQAGETVYMAMLTDTKVKVIFGGLVPQEANIIAEQVYMGELDPDERKHEIYRTIEHHRLKWLDILTRSSSQTGTIGGAHQERSTSTDRGASSNVVDSSNWTDSDTDGESVTHSPFLLPEEDTELASIQYRDLEEQLYEVMATMINQPAQQAVVKVLTGRPRNIRTPTIPDYEMPPDIVRDYEVTRYRAVRFCPPTAEVEGRINQRTTALLAAAAARTKVAAVPLPDVHSIDDAPEPSSAPPKRLRPSPALNPARRKNTAAEGPDGTEGQTLAHDRKRRRRR